MKGEAFMKVVVNDDAMWLAKPLYLTYAPTILPCHSSCRIHSRVACRLRAFWVDAFHPGFISGAQVTRLIADTRAGNCSAVLVEVRRRGDAYYDS